MKQVPEVPKKYSVVLVKQFARSAWKRRIVLHAEPIRDAPDVFAVFVWYMGGGGTAAINWGWPRWKHVPVKTASPSERNSLLRPH